MTTPHVLTAPTDAKTLANADTTTASERLFSSPKGLNEHSLAVATHEDLVRLTGFTDNLLARQRAGKVALAVCTPTLPAADLRREVRGSSPPNAYQGQDIRPVSVLGRAETAIPEPQTSQPPKRLADAPR